MSILKVASDMLQQAEFLLTSESIPRDAEIGSILAGGQVPFKWKYNGVTLVSEVLPDVTVSSLWTPVAENRVLKLEKVGPNFEVGLVTYGEGDVTRIVLGWVRA
jgi:hypothetical protein